MTSTMIKFRNVSKTIGNKQVLVRIRLTVSQGSVVGIIGAKGAGKTTLLRLAAGVLYPDAGEVWVTGKKVHPGLLGGLPSGIGALIESLAFLPQLSGLRNLAMLARIRRRINTNSIRTSMLRIGLNPDNRNPVWSYSLDMRQRLGIAQAIMEEPSVLLLDEPTNGLDQEGRRLLADILEEQTRRGASILLVSDRQADINPFCDKLYSLEEGVLLPIRQRREHKWIIMTNSAEDLELLSLNIPSFQKIGWMNNNLAGTCMGEWETDEELFAFLALKGIYSTAIRKDH
ncbi:Vitamin B12 import ATP-binding protein BtuD [Paenibacillus plantiphilus]|uniref:Vitamin B12 import ATP-binding protein BtuD n=1 Tax=Paenibacillus plantiphilus TaxID=2905650 RepID=A0ABN8GLN2_9BACL|nr:Vitamin B12 import ATP-binding protein BtuD [Paenibacillus plantiphilus]